MTAKPGEIYRHDTYYVNPETGKNFAKFLLVLAAPKGDDIVYRLLTSRDHARSRAPRCDHAGAYPGYYLGAGVCDALPKDTWVDLRRSTDYDSAEFEAERKAKRIRLIHFLPPRVKRHVSLCAANAPDTVHRQSKRIMEALN